MYLCMELPNVLVRKPSGSSDECVDHITEVVCDGWVAQYLLPSFVCPFLGGFARGGNVTCFAQNV